MQVLRILSAREQIIWENSMIYIVQIMYYASAYRIGITFAKRCTSTGYTDSHAVCTKGRVEDMSRDYDPIPVNRRLLEEALVGYGVSAAVYGGIKLGLS